MGSEFVLAMMIIALFFWIDGVLTTIYHTYDTGKTITRYYTTTTTLDVRYETILHISNIFGAL